MLAAVLSGFGLSLGAPWLHRLLRGATGWLFALLPLGLFAYFASFIPQIAAGETIRVVYPWTSSLNVNLSFYLDGLSLLFAFLVNGIGALILIYGGGYLKGHPQLGRFYCLLILFMASMLGLVLADNILTLFVFWELTSISSYLLIGFDHEREESRAAALQALLITGGGGLALLAGLVMLGQIGGTYEVSALLGEGDTVRAHALYIPTLLLVLAGAFTKSAQVPFHFWLPGAMAAPTPVSAYLHSATMVKAGIYLLARFSPVLGGTVAWTTIVTAVGAATMITGGVVALYQTDLKRLLAFSTVSALGSLTMLIGINTHHAIEAMIVFLFAHALYKGALFMLAGAVDHETGTRDVEKLGGLRRAMPITALTTAVAGVSLAGFGPVFSFIGKEMMLESVLEVPGANALLVPATVLGSTFFVVVAAIVAIKPFWGNPTHTPKHPHEAPLSMWLGPAILATLGVVFGIVPNLVAYSIVTPAVGAVYGELAPVSLYLWHGVNLPLILSIVSVVLGLTIFSVWTSFRRATRPLEALFDYGPASWYQVGLDGLNVLARGHTRLVQGGYLRYYFLTIIVTTIVLVSYSYTSRGAFPGLPPWSDVRLYELGLAVLILMGAVATVRAPSRLSAVAALGVVGYGVALTYIVYGAPDLAMTQFMIETLTVILFVFVFYHLPRFTRLSTSVGRLRDAIVACAFGTMMTILVLAATAITPDSSLSRYYAENSRPLAHGRNIVNVILVDFRALDTLGEITVLGVAAIGVFALLKLRLQKRESQ